MRRTLACLGIAVAEVVTAGCRAAVPVASTPAPSAVRVPSVASATSVSQPARPRIRCERLAYTDEVPSVSPKLQFCNDTAEPLTIRRLDVPGLQAVTLPPDTSADVHDSGPVAGDLDADEVSRGPGLLFGVFDQAGSLRGRFLFTVQYLHDPDHTSWVCLSMASEPPFEVRRAKDFSFPCP